MEVYIWGHADRAVRRRGFRSAVKHLSSRHSLSGVYHLAEVWGVIAAAIYTSAVLIPPTSGPLGIGVYLGVLAVIAARQHALMVLTHEAIHSSLSRWANDWLGRVLAAFPVFISLAKWRFIHLSHHQYTHTADDPDRTIYARYPLAASAWWRLLVRDGCGANILSTLKYFIDIPGVTARFNRRFLGQAGERHYQQLSDMRALRTVRGGPRPVLAAPVLYADPGILSYSWDD